MSDAVSLVTTETLARMARAVGFFTRSTYRRIDLAQQVSAVCTGFGMVFTDALPARLALGDVRGTVQFTIDCTRRLIRSTEYVPAGCTVGTIVSTDFFAAPIACR